MTFVAKASDINVSATEKGENQSNPREKRMKTR
jgi:hypothetical protein